MDVELLITGTEVTNGSIVDTNSAWLARRITQLGGVVRRKTAVGDRRDDLADALRAAVRRSDAVVLSGGLGPTDDDLTREIVARVARVPLRPLADHARALAARWRSRGVEMPASNLRQSWVPRGARVIPNATGTAPGFEQRIAGVPVFALPGVPSELRAMFEAGVAPRLAALVGRGARLVQHEMLVLLLPESAVGERTRAALADLPSDAGLEVGWMIGKGGVTVRLSAPRSRQTLLRRAAARLRREFGDLAVELGDSTLEQALAEDLLRTGTTIAIAESCTGGLACEMLTRVPGVSAVLLEGVVAYANRAKQRRLGVRSVTLRNCGAVSRETAREMVRGILRTTGARLGLAVTGIAGPGGGTPEKPVGLVYVAGRLGRDERIEELRLGGDRATIRMRAAAYALLLARRLIREAK